MERASVLLVSDDLQASQFFADVLRQREIDVHAARLASTPFSLSTSQPFALIIIDVYHGEQAGIAYCRQMRSQTLNPILLLGSSKEERHMLEAYNAGAADYIAKPLDLRIFQAKMIAWLRWAWLAPIELLPTLEMGGWRLDPARRCLITPESTLNKLTPLEFRLLHLLLKHAGQLVETETILQRIWGYEGDLNALRNVVSRLRQKIEPDPHRPHYLLNVRDRGYRLQIG